MPLMLLIDVYKRQGLGATYGEIKAKRHSIIIEPNVSTIPCKCDDPKHVHDNLIGVSEKVGVDDIKEYIICLLYTSRCV